jgi:hypothetical protein
MINEHKMFSFNDLRRMFAVGTIRSAKTPDASNT